MWEEERDMERAREAMKFQAYLAGKGDKEAAARLRAAREAVNVGNWLRAIATCEKR